MYGATPPLAEPLKLTDSGAVPAITLALMEAESVPAGGSTITKVDAVATSALESCTVRVALKCA